MRVRDRIFEDKDVGLQMTDCSQRLCSWCGKARNCVYRALPRNDVSQLASEAYINDESGKPETTRNAPFLQEPVVRLRTRRLKKCLSALLSLR